MNHKRKGPKSTRSGCLLCKRHKHQANVKSDRMRDKRRAFKVEEKAYLLFDIIKLTTRRGQDG
jgi:hypothetical protein